MANHPPRTTVLVSGGIDSSACAHLLQAQGHAVSGLFIDYGQAAAAHEAEAARRVMNHLDCPVKTAVLRGDVQFHTGEIQGRNAFLLSTAVMLSPPEPLTIVLGIHAGTSYFDCSEGFLSSTRRLIAEQTDGRIAVIAPFLTWSKGEIFAYFRKTGIPVELTRSCEAGGQNECGKCLSCLDRERFYAG